MNYPHHKFGMATGAGFQNLDDDVFNQQMDLMNDLNVHWIRTSVPWKNVQGKGPDDWNWTRVDRLVSACLDRSIKIIATLAEWPEWARNDIDEPHPAPFVISRYAKFCEELAKRYGHEEIRAFELGNSPNIPQPQWPIADPIMYTEVMRQCYPLIKAADPRIRVLTAGLGGVRNRDGIISGAEFIRGMYAAGAKEFFNAISFHPYSYPYLASIPLEEQQGPKEHRDRSWFHLQEVRQIMEENGDGHKRIWATEYGVPSEGGGTEEEQARLIKDAYETWFDFEWAGPLCVFKLVDDGGDVETVPSGAFMGLVYPSLRKKLAYHKKLAYDTYKTLALPGPHR